MLPLLAAAVEASPSPTALKEWLEVLLYLCGIVLAIGGVYKLFAGKPSKTSLADQPIEVKAHHGHVTRQELQEAHGRISRERDELKREIARVEAAHEKRADKLETKIDANTTATAQMGGQLEQMNANLAGLSQSLGNFLRDQANRK